MLHLSAAVAGMDGTGQQTQANDADRKSGGLADEPRHEPLCEVVKRIGEPSPTNSSDNASAHTSHPNPRHQSSSSLPLVADAARPGSATPGATPRSTPRLYPANCSGTSIPLQEYPFQYLSQSAHSDSPYLHISRSYHDSPIQQATIDPYNIVDDGEDDFLPEPKRRSMLTLVRQSSRDLIPAVAAAGIANGDWGNRSLSTLVGGRKKSSSSKDSNHGPIGQKDGVLQYKGPESSPGGEKSEWLVRQTRSHHKMRWMLSIVIGGMILLAIIGGIIGPLLASRSHKSTRTSPVSGSTNNADTDTSVNGELDKDSTEIKALMNNPDLYKVFPAINYTPWGTQYPLCMTYPPSQNNVTRDLAVLSQLTNQVRLYGTDCNQTEMVLTAIDRLQLTDMTVWLGVWIETNETTNARQTAQMYGVLEQHMQDLSIFRGVIVGNEALYRAGIDKASSETDLVSRLSDVRSNFTARGYYNLSIATSDLGDNWNGLLVDAVDILMSNIHPFFAGVSATDAASWTWDFWQQHDIPLTQDTAKKQIISETGWPSAGGNECGSDMTACPNSTAGSVAGVSEMNTFLSAWVCQALDNGTDYFWFEAFDEPWKTMDNTPGRDWETEWGLMDSGRNLKPGLKIPDCGGRTVVGKERR